MLLPDDQAVELKRWIMQKLDDISDADPDILADYAIALIRAESPEQSLKQNVFDQLEDFLGPIATRFVDELFVELDKISAPAIPRPAPAYIDPYGSGTALEDVHPTRSGHVNLSAASSQAKKRTWNDTQDPANRHGIFTAPRKQLRGSRRGGQRSTTHATGTNSGFSQLHPLFYQDSGLPSVPTGPRVLQNQPTVFDANTALAAMMALQQQILSQFGSPSGEHHPSGLSGLGSVMSILQTPKLTAANQASGSQDRSTGRGRRSKRSNLSMVGPSSDPTNTTIVVEQIPEENFDEDQVRQFFGKFGNIEEVNMYAYKRLATVRFEGHENAQAAIDSPSVIFNNRFVKVFWYNPDAATHSRSRGLDGRSPSASTGFQAPEPEFDRAKFDLDNAEAQKKHEARLRARADAKERAREIQARRVALSDEYEKIIAQLKAKGVEIDGSLRPGSSMTRKQYYDTAALKKQLAALQDEARELGLDPEATDDDVSESRSGHSSRGTYRGNYGRGRGGRGYASSYSGWNDRPIRGASAGGGGNNTTFRGQVYAGGRYNLDLRPRRVKVTLQDDGASWDEGKDESLREHLLSLGDFEAIGSAEDEDGDVATRAVTVVFKDRATAETLFYGSRYIQGLGKLDMAWVANPPAPPDNNSTLVIENQDVDDDDTVMGNAPAGRTNGASENDRETNRDLEEDDYDIAEEDERWVVT